MDPETAHLRELVTQRLDNADGIAARQVAAHKEQHAADQRAVDLALARLNERLEGMNQFRAQLDRQAALFVDRDYLTAQLAVIETGITKDIEAITTRLNKEDEDHKRRQERQDARLDVLERNAANIAGRLWAAGVVVGLVFTLLSLFLKFFVP